MNSAQQTKSFGQKVRELEQTQAQQELKLAELVTGPGAEVQGWCAGLGVVERP